MGRGDRHRDSVNPAHKIAIIDVSGGAGNFYGCGSPIGIEIGDRHQIAARVQGIMADVVTPERAEPHDTNPDLPLGQTKSGPKPFPTAGAAGAENPRFTSRCV
jgi:hypothetical protein